VGAEQGFAGEPFIEIVKQCAPHGEITETITYEPPPGIAWDDATYTGSAYPVYGWPHVWSTLPSISIRMK